MSVSYHPGPEAMHINAFSISCSDRPSYAFHLFTVVGNVLDKIVLDAVTGIIDVPY